MKPIVSHDQFGLSYLSSEAKFKKIQMTKKFLKISSHSGRSWKRVLEILD